MKKALLVACFSLFALAVAAPAAHAGGRFFVGFGIGFGGGYYPAYGYCDPWVYPPYAYGYYPPYGRYSPYLVRPWASYYAPRYYAPYRSYLLRMPRYRVPNAAVHNRVYAQPAWNVGARSYGPYVPRRYGGR